MIRRFAATGFTLLEVIMTFVILAMVCVIAVSSFTGGVTRTDVPIKQLQADASLQLVLENMIADKAATYPNDLVGFSANLGATNTAVSNYATGSSSTYIITQKQFVCPSSGTFANSPSTNQFLLVTIKPDSHSGIGLSYLFKADNNTCGGGS